MNEPNEAPGNVPTREKKTGFLGGGKSFLEAWVFVIVIVLLIFGGVSLSRYLKNTTQTSTTTQEKTKEETVYAPKDIPLYQGAVATVHRVAGNVEFYEYDLPQGSVSTVNAFYTEKMSANKWRRLPGSNDYEAKYSQADGRTATILLSYEAGKVHLKLSVKSPQ